MSRKPKINCEPFECSPYESKAYVRIFLDMVNSPAFKDLSYKQQLLYFYMKIQFGQKDSKKPNGKHLQFYFNRGLYKNTLELYSNDGQFRKDRDALIKHGFIICIDDGSLTRSKTIYQFSDKWQLFDKENFQIETKHKTLSLLRKERLSHGKINTT